MRESQNKFDICHPPARIRDLRKKYGYDFIKDRWIEKPIKVLKNGKETNITQRFKEYFIAEDKKEITHGFKQ